MYFQSGFSLPVFIALLARAVSVPVSQHSGGREATTLVATKNVCAKRKELSVYTGNYGKEYGAKGG